MRIFGVCVVILLAVSGRADEWGGYPSNCQGKPDGYYCNDSNACTQTDTCRAGQCIGSNSVVCVASNPCAVGGTCNPSTGVCSDPVPLYRKGKLTSWLCPLRGYF